MPNQAQYDAFTTELAAVEELLYGLRPKTTDRVSVVIPGDSNSRLSYSKASGKWMLAYSDDTMEEEKSLGSMPVSTRIICVYYLRDLIKALRADLTEFDKQLDLATHALRVLQVDFETIVP